MNRNYLIKIIHVAKRNLNLRDEDYQALLLGATGKESCKEMSSEQLKAAYQALSAIGFKKSRKTTSTKPQERRPAPRVSIGDKIVAVWVIMGQHGVITDTSRHALDAYVVRMTKAENGGVGVASIAWLDDKLAVRVLEALKRWHMRVMREVIKQRGHVPLSGYGPLVEQFEMKK
ncbi:gp16 family protein [Aeromonas piscicola]|uniref:gp16 family protein n=1 Tax=Aeromonas piscicola TaxID=600645 RepID=UPI0005B4010F|nr:regulatory protein GemA [Aeromonas piscicola]